MERDPVLASVVLWAKLLPWKRIGFHTMKTNCVFFLIYTKFTIASSKCAVGLFLLILRKTSESGITTIPWFNIFRVKFEIFQRHRMTIHKLLPNRVRQKNG